MTNENTNLNPQTRTITVENKDTGSLHALPAGTEKPSLPLRIHVEGEKEPRKVTYIMGGPKSGWLFCCKGTGKFPVGKVTFQILHDEAPVCIPTDPDIE